MDNLPEGISADTAATLRNLYAAYQDWEREIDRLDRAIADAEQARRDARARAAGALKDYHRRLGRIQREAGRQRRGQRP